MYTRSHARKGHRSIVVFERTLKDGGRFFCMCRGPRCAVSAGVTKIRPCHAKDRVKHPSAELSARMAHMRQTADAKLASGKHEDMHAFPGCARRARNR